MRFVTVRASLSPRCLRGRQPARDRDDQPPQQFREVKRGQVWRVVSWPLANIQPDVFMVLGIFLVYWFGREIERIIGRVRMAQFLVALIVVGSAVALAVILPPVNSRRTTRSPKSRCRFRR